MRTFHSTKSKENQSVADLPRNLYEILELQDNFVRFQIAIIRDFLGFTFLKIKFGQYCKEENRQNTIFHVSLLHYAKSLISLLLHESHASS